MERIVVGVDPSPAGQAALRWALAEARDRAVPLRAVRTWLTPVFGLYHPAGTELAEAVPQACAEAQQVAEEQLRLAVDAVPGGDAVDATAVAALGAPAQVLVESARDAALLVVGTRGLGALSRAVLGSVSSSVLHHASVPVAVVPEGPGAGTGGRVLVGVDHSAESLAALRTAIGLAQRSGRVLSPVFVHEPLHELPPGAGLAHLEAAERASLEHAVALEGGRDLTVVPEVLTGHAAAALTGLATPDDVLVLGSRGRGGFVGLLLGSTSTACAQHATCPVVVVPSRG